MINNEIFKKVNFTQDFEEVESVENESFSLIEDKKLVIRKKLESYIQLSQDLKILETFY